MEGLYYKHSGKFGMGGVLYALVVGSVVACVGAFVYAYLVLYLPFVYINALVTAGFGAGTGFVIATLLKKQKVRSDAVALVVTLVVTGIAYYYAWAAWIWALVRRNDGEASVGDFFNMLVRPGVVWNLVVDINQHGAWSIRGGEPVTGWALTIVWVAELALIFGVSLAVAYAQMDESPFCETCEEWGTKKPNVLQALAADVATAKQRIEAKDFHYLESAGAPRPDSMEWLRLHLFSCPKCGSFHTLDAEKVKIKVESGKRKENTSTAMHHLLLTASEAEALQRLGEKMGPKSVAEMAQSAGASA
ncbi:MAG TPA: hypothetical protein VL382_07410 [Terriglobales bacterium]|jgi:hypothetical protein|nr:hypothetical protein [Terriglobales bacterium]